MADGIGFAVLNLMSDNPGMRWDRDTRTSSAMHRKMERLRC